MNNWSLKLADKVVDDEDRTKRNIVVTMRRYNVDKRKSTFAQVHKFAMNEDEKLQKIVYAGYKLKRISK